MILYYIILYIIYYIIYTSSIDPLYIIYGVTVYIYIYIYDIIFTVTQVA